MPNTHRRRRRDETVASHPSAVVTRFTISSADKWRHNDVIVEKVITIYEYYTTRLDSNVYKHAAT